MAKRKGLVWVMVSVELDDHPKTRALVRRVDCPFAALYVIRVWSYFGRWNEEGWIEDSEDAVKDIEAAARWGGTPGNLVGALVEVGFLRRHKERLIVSNWSEWSGSYAERKAADRKRKAEQARAGKEGAEVTVPPDFQRNSAAPSPSPSPSLCPSASEGRGLGSALSSATSSGSDTAPTPFWHDEPWINGMKRSLGVPERDALDVAISDETRTVSKAHLNQRTPGWRAAEAEARRRIEAKFSGAKRGGRS